MGYGGSCEFGVGRTLTRGELATMHWRISEPDAAAAYTEDVQVATRNETGLAGVEDGKFYTAAANWAVASGVIQGYSGTDFAADDPVTCEQLLAILARLTGNADGAHPEALAHFSDGHEVSGWAERACAWARNVGLVDGYEEEDGTRTLRPQEEILRERIAAIIMNAYQAGILG